MFGAPCEAWRNVDCCEESGFSDVEGGVAGDGVVENFFVGNHGVDAGWGNVLLLSAEFYCGKEGGITFPPITASRSMDIKPFKDRETAFVRISFTGGVWFGLVMPRAPAAALIACGILVGIAVGAADCNIFCTAAGTSVPTSVPFAMASIKWLVGSILRS